MRVDRRTGMAAIAAAGLLGGTRLGAVARPLFTWPLGIQLWSVNRELGADVPGTLGKLRAIGFREVEAAGLHGLSPDAFRQAVAAAGLAMPSAHAGLADLRKDPDAALSIVRDLGVSWLVCSGPEPDRPVPAGMSWNRGLMAAMTLDAWKRAVDWLNRIGRLAEMRGLGFAYHNQPLDFALYESVRPYDLILRETDPALVKLELDVGWAIAGGADPVALMHAHPDRFVFLHVKGLTRRPRLGQVDPDVPTTEIGNGDAIRWQPVFAAAHRAGIRGIFLEQEPPYTRPVFQSLAIDAAALLRL